MMDALEIVEIRSEEARHLALAIRHEVFCREQGVDPGEEFDGRDGTCRHYLARLGGRAVGAARLRPLGEGAVKIERVAVLAAARGRGAGHGLMARAIRDATDGGAARIVVFAQCQAEMFYRKLAFLPEGPVFEEAGITHIRMVRAV
jgi:predicted GNAT family N-acyltransferase